MRRLGSIAQLGKGAASAGQKNVASSTAPRITTTVVSIPPNKYAQRGKR